LTDKYLQNATLNLQSVIEPLSIL